MPISFVTNVTNGIELKKAIASKKDEVVISGELATQIHEIKGRSNESKNLGIVPVVPIILAASLGMALILAVISEYEEIEFSMNPPRIKLRRKK